MADEVLQHMIKLYDYRDLQAPYDEKKVQAGLQATKAQPLSIGREQIMRSAPHV